MVVVFGDHGWKLGEHSGWSKHSNFDIDTRVPLLVRVPGLTRGVGYSEAVRSAVVELVDIMPTLYEAAGLGTLPACPVDSPWSSNTCSDGQSFLSLARGGGGWTKPHALSQYRRLKKPDFELVGYSLTTARYRFTAWVSWLAGTRTDWTDKNPAGGYELYDHQTDPKETQNLVSTAAEEAI